MTQTVQIYVNLLEEGVDTIRPTQAVIVGDGLYRLLPTDDYDSEDEVWEFVPGTVVKVSPIQTHRGKSVLVAVEKVG